MSQSMTGFGKASSNFEGHHIFVELRSWNNRFMDVRVSGLSQQLSLEARVVEYVQDTFDRGSFHVHVIIKNKQNTHELQSIEKHAAFLKRVHRKLQLEAPLSMDVIFKTLPQKGAFSKDRALQDHVFDVCQKATQKLISSRAKEGRHLVQDLKKRIKAMKAMKKKLAAASQTSIQERQEAFAQKWKEHTDQALDPERITLELALMLDKSDVTEELVRLQSHLHTIEDVLASAPEVLGRKLDFLIQEINREINTVGSKASDAQMTSIVVNFKSELEKVREQSQNLQ